MSGALQLTSLDPTLAIRCAVREGQLIIGRASTADLQIDLQHISKAHARIFRRGRMVTVEDLQSTNGTQLNGKPVHGPVAIQVGDRLQLGPVALELEGDGSADRTAGGASRFDIHAQSADEIWNVGGSVSKTTITGEDDPMDELMQGVGAGRLLAVIGLLAAIIGFVLWMSFIFSGMTSASDPFTDIPTLFGVPRPILGFALFGGGGLLMALGSAMSRQARRRRGDAVRPVRQRRA